MKKLIAVTAILSVMFLGAGTSQALMGVPDAVPGEDILIPFFMVSMTGQGSDNTLITITDVNGKGAKNCLHLRLYDVSSVEQYNDDITMTAYDVYVTDAKTIIGKMSTLAKKALEIDLDGDGTKDHWVGYIHFVAKAVGNNFIAHVYQVAVSDGMVAGYTGVSLENASNVANSRLEAYKGVASNFAGLEALSANALYNAREFLEDSTWTFADPAWFRLLPRIYIADTTSSNTLIIWTDVEGSPVSISAPGTLHVNFFDQAENAVSSPLKIPKELNFINVIETYPLGLAGTDPYMAGWIDIATPDLDGNGFKADRLWLGYSLQRAKMADGSTLDVILEAHRDAGTGSSPTP